MGMFKSLHQLHKQSKEINKDFNPGQMMADGQARMAEMTSMLANQNRAAEMAVAGIDATATVVAVRQGTAMINFQPVVEIDLTVLIPGRPPLPVTVEQVVDQVNLARLQPGASVTVKVDPLDAGSVFIQL